MPPSTIILFRSAQPEDAYEAVFNDAGWQVCSIPVLRFRFKNRDILETKLVDAGGLIITSPRAGDMVGNVFLENPPLRDAWQRRSIVCIGDRSAEAVQKAGLLPRKASGGRAESVAEAVIQRAGGVQEHWLFVCGNLRREVLPAQLRRAGVAFEEIEVYETLPIEALALEKMRFFSGWHPGQPPDWVVFYSPSGVQAVFSGWPAAWGQVKKAAIGATTAEAIRAVGWDANAIAERPEPDALLQAVQASTT